MTSALGFEAEWLAARRPYDDDALDLQAILAIRGWGAALPVEYAPVVVDLGSGTGIALERVRRWLAPRQVVAYAVDRDPTLLAHVVDAGGDVGTRSIVGDLLAPLASLGGPADGTVDLVVAHALADLVPLDRLATRTGALLKPGGLAHIALTYDGLTAFSPVDDPDHAVDAEVESAVIAAFHRHMDRPATLAPKYGGSTAGRRIGPALAAAGFDVLVDAPSIWTVTADRGGGSQVLARLIRFVVEAVGEVDDVPVRDLHRWATARRAALDRGEASVRVAHRDVLVRAAWHRVDRTDVCSQPTI